MRKLVLDLFGIAFGTLVSAVGVNFFLVPNQLNDGGLTGVAILLHYLVQIPIGLTVLALNLPLLAVVTYLIGVPFLMRSVAGVVLFSLWLSVLPIQALTSVPLLAAVYGGALGGAGLGITFRFGGSTGGDDLVARLLRYYTHLSMGAGLLAIDVVIIAATGLVFGLQIAMYSAIALFVGTRVVDLIQDGLDVQKAALIVTAESERITEAVTRQMRRGVTTLAGRGGYTGAARDVLFVVFSRRELVRIKDIVYALDPDAFVVITAAHEVMGEGFKELEGRRHAAKVVANDTQIRQD